MELIVCGKRFESSLRPISFFLFLNGFILFFIVCNFSSPFFRPPALNVNIAYEKNYSQLSGIRGVKFLFIQHLFGN